MSHQVEDTAFVIAHYRAQDPTFSKDPYAFLWESNGAARIARKFDKRVSPFETILHCARNRAILNYLIKYSHSNHTTCIINIGAGFSMYPFVLAEKIQHIEIDLPNVAAYKKEKIAAFIKQEELPEREVSYLSFDITKKEGLSALGENIASCKARRKIILIEGLFYFLSRIEIEQLLSFCRKTLAPNDILICESYNDALEGTNVYKRLMDFFGTDFKLNATEHGNLAHSFYKKLEGFKLVERTSSFTISQEEGKLPISIPEEEVLNEHIYVLEKI